MEIFHTPPESSSFVLLAEHQARTPSSFHSGPPVLYYHSKQCRIVLLERDLRASPALKSLRQSTETAQNGNDTAAAGEEEEEKETVIDDVDVWVTSDKFLLYATTTTSGVSIPYPSISLHAIQRLRLPTTNETQNENPELQGLYMQIATPQTATATNDDEEEEEEPNTPLTLIPPTTTTDSTLNTTTSTTTQLTTAERAMTEDLSDKPDETPTQMLYAAVSACSNLHPDPAAEEDEDEDGDEGDGPRGALLQAGFAGSGSGDAGAVGGDGLPPPVEGSSGWITAENMHEFFDEEGNWIAGGEAPGFLGPGAGSVRQREEDDDDHEGEGVEGGQEGVDGGEETKWRRTD